MNTGVNSYLKDSCLRLQTKAANYANHAFFSLSVIVQA
jgi:hypothetical protein